jgi:TRAP-type C4-dicarboxylate transport system substrate-binding protein
MKRMAYLGVVLLVTGALLSGFSTPAAAKMIKLIYSSENPSNSWDAVECEYPFLDTIEKATNGVVKIERYSGSTLAKATDVYPAVKSGTVDIGWTSFVALPGAFPLQEVNTLPFLGFESAQQESEVAWRLFDKYPEVQKQFDAKVLLLYTTTPYFLVTTNKQVKTMEDLKGMKIRIPGGPPTEAFKALGAIPVYVPMPDTYIALQKGIVDGMAVAFTGLANYRQYEVCKYVSYISICGFNIGILMNKAKWASLPADIQGQISKVIGLPASIKYGYNADRCQEPVLKQIQKEGYKLTYYTIPPEEAARWQKVAGKPVWDAWVESKKAKYPIAPQLLQSLLDFKAAYKPTYR